MFHVVYGFTATSARGDQDSDDPRDRFDWCAAIRVTFQREGLSPSSLLRALEAAARRYERMPTSGQLKDLARGRAVSEEFEG
jgi:hypothetical protein